jgi:hypothetical protein
MKTHKKKQKTYRKKSIKHNIRQNINKRRTKKGGAIPLSKNWRANASEKAAERGNRRLEYLKGQAADKFRALGHAIANMKNPIVTAYQLIEKKVFGWDVPKTVKPPFIPKHKSVSFKQFLKSDIPELTEKAKKKKAENPNWEEDEKKKKEEEKKKKEEEKKKKEEEKKKKEDEKKGIIQPQTNIPETPVTVPT